MTDDIEKLLAFGQMALEQGWYDQARGYFEQVLALAPSNGEAMKGLARVNEMLSRKEAIAVEPIEDEPVEPEREYVEWLEKCPFCKEGRICRDRKPLFGRFGPALTKTYVCDFCTTKLIPRGSGEREFQCVLIDKRYPEMQVYHNAKLTREELIRISEGGCSDLEQKRLEAQQRETQLAQIAQEEATKRKLQPRTLGEFIGQRKIKESLAVSIEAAKVREEALGHILLCSPEGCGKKTLAHVIAYEMGGDIKITSGPAIKKAGDLEAILINLRKGDILFIDEVHRLRRALEEVLYPAMEDFALDIIFGKGSSARSFTLKLPRFTVIGATDQPKRVSSRLRQRFEHIYDFDLYDKEAIGHLVLHRAEVLGINIDEETSWLIGRGAEGNIREAVRLLDRVRDYAKVRAGSIITQGVTREALTTLGIDVIGWAVEGTVPSSGEREAKPTSLTWQDFENRVAKLFEALGYQNVRLTPRAGDEGKDIVMEWADPLHGSRMIYVECKHWKANSVGRREVQILHSAVVANPKVNQGVIVTTGRFTDGAIAYAKQVEVIELIDGEKLQALIAKART